MYCLFAVNYSVIPDCNLTLMLSSLYTLFFFGVHGHIKFGFMERYVLLRVKDPCHIRDLI